MTAGLTYTALVYNTITGFVIREAQFIGDPDWLAQVNDPGSWSLTIPLETPEQTVMVREWCVPWRFSVAILYGDFVCQAGPVVSATIDDVSRTVKIGGSGLWGLFNRRVLHNNTWNPTLKSIGDATAGLTYTDSLYNIARSIIDESTSWANRAGSSLPVDIPAADPAGGAYTISYNGYDLGFAGVKLQELTQNDNGSDVLFQPYITVGSPGRYVRHKMLIGTPLLIQPGVPLLFDYPSTVDSIKVSIDGQNFATSAFAKGSGSEAATLIGYAASATYTSLGWPAVDMVDSEHNATDDLPSLNGWATADVALFSSQLEQWKVTVRTDRDPQLAVYLPGHYANYQVNDHAWIPDGLYNFRIIGLSHGSDDTQHTVNHVLQAVRG